MAVHRIQKLFDGCADVPDYKVNEHIKRKFTLRVALGDKYMDLTWKQLKTPLKKSELFRSKYYPDQTYRLYSYKWSPCKPLSEEQLFKRYVY